MGYYNPQSHRHSTEDMTSGRPCLPSPCCWRISLTSWRNCLMLSPTQRTELAIFPEYFSITCKNMLWLFILNISSLCGNVGGATDLTQHPIDAVWLQKRGLMGEFAIERTPSAFNTVKAECGRKLGDFCLQNKSIPKGEATVYWMLFHYCLSVLL